MRLSYLLAAPLMVLSASAAILQRDFAIEGCLSLTSILDPAVGIVGNVLTGSFATEGACVAACRARTGSNYAYFLALPALPTNPTCYCSANGPPLSALIGAAVAVDGATSAGVCGALGYEAIRLNTDFTLRACAATNAYTNTAVGQSSPVTTVPQCLAQCGAFAYAIVNYAGACTCATGTQLNNAASAGACSRVGNSNAIYFNGGFPLASRTVRKRDLYSNNQKSLGLCPTGLQACLIGDDSVVGIEGFECLDTRSELESCGGCTNGYADLTVGASTIGTDLPGVALGGATCSLGKCEIFACKKGHNLVNGRCERA